MSNELAELAALVQTPTHASRVYKDECILSFDTPESVQGVYVDLQSFECFSHEFVQTNHRLTGNRVYLNIRRRRVRKPEQEEAKPRVLGFGVAGGFDADYGFEWLEAYEIVVLPGFERFPFPSDDIPARIHESAAGVIQASSATMQDQVVAFSLDEKVEESKFAENLVQLDNGKKIPPSNWVCDEEGCGITEGLWLNLTDGYIGCSRGLWTGGGGNSHALKHYEQTSYPLSAKLGTICGDISKIDVFSYAEGGGNMVTDAKIVQHLAHWGIDIAGMQASEKSTKELELSLNEKFEATALEKHGEKVQGCGYTGIRNLGNSCYMNSVMQVLFSTAPFRRRYFENRDAILRNAPIQGAAESITVQLSKLADGLLSGRYCLTDEEIAAAAAIAAGAAVEASDDAEASSKAARQRGIAPKMIKHLLGHNHQEFATNRQQDALEYYLHVLERISRADKADHTPAENSVVRHFQFGVEERIQCSQSLAVRLINRADYSIAVPVPLSDAVNHDEVAKCKERIAAGEKISQDEIVRPRVPLEKCLQAFGATEEIAGFYSSAINGRTIGLKTTRLASFPDILAISVRKFYVDSSWVPQKLDVLIDVPDEIDLEFLRAKGLQPGETLLPEESGGASSASAPAAPIADQALLADLVAMGFPENSSRKALILTKNAGAEQAINFMMENDMDSIADPSAGASTSSSSTAVDEVACMQLISLGIGQKHAERALRETGGNVERAAEWAFSHEEEPESMEDTSAAVAPASTSAAPGFIDGSSKYRLLACISHIGKTAQSGHYLCHIRKDGRWTLFNDEVVARCDPVPKEMAYIYFFERI